MKVVTSDTYGGLLIAAIALSFILQYSSVKQFFRSLSSLSVSSAPLW
ncbi:hypothetical protein [Nostoc sp.]